MHQNNAKPYDVVELIECIADANSFEQFKEEYGKTIVCGYARVDGWAVGIVANQRTDCKNIKKAKCNWVALFIMIAPIKLRVLFLTAIKKKYHWFFYRMLQALWWAAAANMPALLKMAPKLVNAVANSVVPKITIITGNSFGAGNYAMCGKAYDPRFIYAWPSAKIAVMGGEQAAKTLLQIQVSGKEVSDAEQKELLE